MQNICISLKMWYLSETNKKQHAEFWTFNAKQIQWFRQNLILTKLQKLNLHVISIKVFQEQGFSFSTQF